MFQTTSLVGQLVVRFRHKGELRSIATPVRVQLSGQLFEFLSQFIVGRVFRAVHDRITALFIVVHDGAGK